MLLCFFLNPNPEFPSAVHLRRGFTQTRSVEVKFRCTMMADSSITSSVMIFPTFDLHAVRSRVHNPLLRWTAEGNSGLGFHQKQSSIDYKRSCVLGSCVLANKLWFGRFAFAVRRVFAALLYWEQYG